MRTFDGVGVMMMMTTVHGDGGLEMVQLEVPKSCYAFVVVRYGGVCPGKIFRVLRLAGDVL